MDIPDPSIPRRGAIEAFTRPLFSSGKCVRLCKRHRMTYETRKVKNKKKKFLSVFEDVEDPMARCAIRQVGRPPFRDITTSANADKAQISAI